jgi:hypothetical protein
VAQHGIGAHFGAGVEGVGEDLGEEEDTGHWQRICLRIERMNGLGGLVD